jgi:hypothetical protein
MIEWRHSGQVVEDTVPFSSTRGTSVSERREGSRGTRRKQAREKERKRENTASSVLSYPDLRVVVGKRESDLCWWCGL